MKGNQSEKSVPEKPIRDSAIGATHLEEQIRLRAYQIYEKRGRQDGFAEQDWMQAEAEILQKDRTFNAAA